MARPQVHGYDMACITALNNFKFASGAEEKVVRGFSAPANFIRNFGHICNVDIENVLGNLFLEIFVGKRKFYII